MSCTVIIVGYNAENRFLPASVDPCSADPPFEVIAACPKCIISVAAVTFPTATISGRLDGYILGFDSSDKSKPAESYVFKFDDSGHAERWLRSVTPRTQLVGKTVLVLDPSDSRCVPAA